MSAQGAGEIYCVSKDLYNTNVVNLSRKEKVSSSKLLPGESLRVQVDRAKNILIQSSSKKLTFKGNTVVFIKSSTIKLTSLKRYGARGRAHPQYRGLIAVFVKDRKLRVALILDIDDYLNGVLQSEIPASYHIEAIKCQAVAARTYSLNPRINHNRDAINVCDSYLCCQYFGGLNTKISNQHKLAIKATHHQVLTYSNKPILALFSSNSGGHTEAYENCFSDPETGQFPPPAIPYLKGVAEFTTSLKNIGSEAYLKKLWLNSFPKTKDAWSHHFKWSVSISANQLESQLHVNAEKMMSNPTTAPFVVAPPSNKFGHIKDIVVLKRGVSGVIVDLLIKTSHGDWQVSKELVIRDFFVVPRAKIRRLKSARFFIKKIVQANGTLSSVKLCGLGWGHGVGMQQTGAQGWAKSGLSYGKILRHYYPSTNLEVLN